MDDCCWRCCFISVCKHRYFCGRHTVVGIKEKGSHEFSVYVSALCLYSTQNKIFMKNKTKRGIEQKKEHVKEIAENSFVNEKLYTL